MAARQIDNRKSAESEPNRAAKEITFIVRATVRNASCHPLYVSAAHWSITYEIKLSADSTHSDDVSSAN
jgi:hypothetical protein